MHTDVGCKGLRLSTCAQLNVVHKNIAILVTNVNVILVVSFGIHDHSTRLSTFKLKADIIVLSVISWFEVCNGCITQSSGTHTPTCSANKNLGICHYLSQGRGSGDFLWYHMISGGGGRKRSQSEYEGGTVDTWELLSSLSHSSLSFLTPFRSLAIQAALLW